MPMYRYVGPANSEPGLLHAPQVGDRDDCDEHETDDHPVVGESREAPGST